jgi:hypothetical protein
VELPLLWTYLYSFVRPKTGEVHWLILPTVNTRVFSLALEHFARAKFERARRQSAFFLCSIEPDGTQARRSKYPKR